MVLLDTKLNNSLQRWHALIQMKDNDAKKIQSINEIKVILTTSHQGKQRYYLAVMTSLPKKIKKIE